LTKLSRNLSTWTRATARKEKNYKILYKLNPLIEPLQKLSRPGQVLVFSPCGNLQRIPLHALKIDAEALIHRNPIIYTSSLSALITAFETRQCTQTAPTTTTPPTPHPLRAAIYGAPPTPAGIAALHATASTFATQPHTATAFTTTLQTPGLHLVHYHGHAHFSPTASIDQSLEFADGHLTLRDIFDIPPGRGRGFHATLLGCGSGASTTARTDDVIGLVPGFFHAGAASAVGSLWPFADGDAALYAEYFYGDAHGVMRGDGEVLEEDVEGMRIEDGERKVEAGMEGFWNLAKANQRAVLKMREQKPELYHWGAFVLSGWWTMRVPHMGKKGWRWSGCVGLS